MITALIILLASLSTVVSAALIAACAVSGRQAEPEQCTAAATVPAIAEMQLPQLPVR